MGLLVLAGVAALVLTLLTLVTIAVVQLVLLVTLRNTLLLVAAIGVYWFVDSRRRQVAKGFYSCTEVPSSAKRTATATQANELKPTKEKRADHKVLKTRETKKEVSFKLSSKRDDYEEKSNRSESSVPRSNAPLTTKATADSVDASGAATTSEVAAMRQSNVSDGAESSCDEVPVAAAAAAAAVGVAVASSPSSPSSSSSSTPSSPRAGVQLPDLRHRKWKFPTQSMPLKRKGEALLQHGHGHGRRSTGGSASNSPRRPELFGSPRSVAMEQKLMKTALEADGYWIGDFRVPPPLPKRSLSLGAKVQAVTTTTSTSTRTAQEKRPASRRT